MSKVNFWPRLRSSSNKPWYPKVCNPAIWMVVNIGPLLHEKVDRIFPIAQARGSIPRASRWCPIYDRQSREIAFIEAQSTRLKGGRVFPSSLWSAAMNVELYGYR